MEWNEEQVRLLREILPGVAQQLRLPLNNLSLAAQWLVPEEPGEKEQRSAAILQQNYYRLLRTVNNMSLAPLLLDDAPLEKGNVDIVRWLEDRCAEAEGLYAEKGVALTWHSDKASHVTAVNEEAMDRLLWNLLSNALKFTPSGGSVSVSLRFAQKQVLLYVADTGCGIAPDRMDTVFDRWLHTPEAAPQPHGLGLGLALCRRVAEGHGGRIMLDSRVGHGTTVTVALPDERRTTDRVRQSGTDYAGGFSQVLLELSDGLPYAAFTPEKLDM